MTTRSVDMVKLGPRQKELIAHIQAHDGEINLMNGVHPYFWVTHRDPQRLVNFARVYSLIDRGILVKVQEDWSMAVYKLADTVCLTCNGTGLVTKAVEDFERDHKLRTGLPAGAIMELACPDCKGGVPDAGR